MKKPKGILVAIGGGEDKENNKKILSDVLALADKKKPTIAIVTTATDEPKATADDYKEAYKGLAAEVTIINIKTRKEAADKKNMKALKNCDILFFSGGNQIKLTTLLGGTAFLDEVKQKYWKDERFVVAGTSAGAAAMSSTMILSGNSEDALIKGELQLSNGLDFINSIFIDTHFTERGRMGRLIQTVTCNPAILGIGLSEDTAIIIKKGTHIEVIGSGLVGILDGLNIKYTNISEIEDGEPITVQGLNMDVLGHGNKYAIDKRELVVKDKKEKDESEKKKNSSGKKKNENTGSKMKRMDHEKI